MGDFGGTQNMTAENFLIRLLFNMHQATSWHMPCFHVLAKLRFGVPRLGRAAPPAAEQASMRSSASVGRGGVVAPTCGGEALLHL